MSFLFPETRLDEALEEIEDAIGAVDLSSIAQVPGTTTDANASERTSYVLPDRLGQWEHLAVVVSAPSTRDTERTDGRTHQWLEDSVVVELRVDAGRVTGQRALRNLATAHEQTLRRVVLGCDQRFRPSFKSTTRTLIDGRWLSLRLAFTVERIERAGVAA